MEQKAESRRQKAEGRKQKTFIWLLSLERDSTMAKLNMVEAINLGLREEMERDNRVVVLGEDVGKEGGVFRVTDKLQERFGADRVIDTPLAESGIVGVAFGMAVNGLRPVAEIQFEGFLYPCLDQINNHISRIRNRSRGRFICPLVIRTPYGGGIHAPEHHSDSPEAILAHIPGLKVVIPATPYEARVAALLYQGSGSGDFMEPKRIYRRSGKKSQKAITPFHSESKVVRREKM
jgi:pyruvate dehydrogenase E1 component beta subunit